MNGPMEPQHFIQFAQRIGHQATEIDGLHWYEAFSRVWICCPFETRIDPQHFDSAPILQERGLMARYCCDVEHGISSFRHIINQKDYDLHSMNSKARNQTRRGLENCESGPLDVSELRHSAPALHIKTLQRQGRKIPRNFDEYWRNYFDALADCQCATLWGSRYEGRLAAFLISFRVGTVENVSIIRSDEELLKLRPNNAMLFTFLKHAMSQSGVSEVCIGMRSLQNGMSSLDSFKRCMGFEEQPIGQRIALRPSLQIAVPRAVARVVGRAVGNFRNEYAARLSGALTCYADQPQIQPQIQRAA